MAGQCCACSAKNWSCANSPSSVRLPLHAMADCLTISSSEASSLRCSDGGRTNRYRNCGTTAAKSLQRVARMCARWAEDNASIVADSDPNMGTLINRDADNWRSLFTIADMVGADWPERIRDAAAVLTPRESEATGPMLLGDMKTVFDEKGLDRLASVEI